MVGTSPLACPLSDNNEAMSLCRGFTAGKPRFQSGGARICSKTDRVVDNRIHDPPKNVRKQDVDSTTGD
jgi:hypothetical protein